MLYLKRYFISSFFFFFNDTATIEIYTLSLHDALPIFAWVSAAADPAAQVYRSDGAEPRVEIGRAHVELQSPVHLVCRLLLEKKKKNIETEHHKKKKKTKTIYIKLS